MLLTDARLFFLDIDLAPGRVTVHGLLGGRLGGLGRFALPLGTLGGLARFTLRTQLRTAHQAGLDAVSYTHLTLPTKRIV